MKMENIIILGIIGLCVALAVTALMLTGTQTENQAQKSTLEEFTARIAQIDDEGRAYKNDFNLYRVSKLQQLTREANLNTEACLQYLISSGKTHRQRYMALMSMSGLGLDYKIEFLSQLEALADAGKLRPSEVYHAVFPPFGQSTQFVLHYRDPRVVRFLTSLLSKSESDAFLKRDIQQTLSGEAVINLLQYWKIEIATGQGWPLWTDVLIALWLLASGIWLPFALTLLIFVGFALLLAMTFPRTRAET